MASCYDGMRAALRRNIEGLAHLSADQKEALLESQMGMAIAASESGRPFVEIYPPAEESDVHAEAGEALLEDDSASSPRLLHRKGKDDGRVSS